MSQFEKPWGNYLLEGFLETNPPEGISWMPQTVGWKIIGIILLIIGVHTIYRAWKRYKFDIYRRDAMKWFSHVSPQNYAHIPAVLKRTAQRGYSRDAVNELTGKAWDEWLDQQCPKTNFRSKCPQVLQKLAYAPMNTISENEILMVIEEVKLWVKYHEVNL